MTDLFALTPVALAVGVEVRKHAELSPSSAKRWTSCTASIGASRGKPNESNPASRQGTVEHEAAAECLINDLDPNVYLGREFVFLDEREEMWVEALPAARHSEIRHRIVLDEDAIDRIDTYVRYVRELVERVGGVLLVEKRVRIDHITGEPGAGGTTDVAILTPTIVYIIDYKSGQERIDAYEVLKPAGVNVITGAQEPEVRGPNLQLAHYASGTLRDNGWMVPDATHIVLIIVQPRLNAISEFSLTVEALHQRIDWIRSKANETRDNPQFVPSESNCHFCPARFTCEVREKACLEIALDGFTPGDCRSLVEAKPRRIDSEWLGAMYDKMGMLKQFIKDIHVRVYTELAAGRPVINSQGEALKLVEGRAGHRFFTDEQRAKESLVLFGLQEREIFNIELRSPSQLEKLTKSKRQGKGLPMLPPRLRKDQWAALTLLVSQPPGRPAIAMASDDRPAITPALDGFTDFSTLVDDDLED